MSEKNKSSPNNDMIESIKSGIEEALGNRKVTAKAIAEVWGEASNHDTYGDSTTDWIGSIRRAENCSYGEQAFDAVLNRFKLEGGVEETVTLEEI